MLNLPNQPTESNHHSTQTASINNLQPTAAGKRNSSAKRVPAEPLLPLPLDAPMLLRPGQPIRTPNLTTPSASHRPMGHKQDKSTHRLHKSTRTATLSSASLSPTRSDASVEVFNLPPMAQTVADASSSTTAAESLSPEVSTSGNLLGQDTSVYQQLRSTPSLPSIHLSSIQSFHSNLLQSYHYRLITSNLFIGSPPPGGCSDKKDLNLPILPLAEQCQTICGSDTHYLQSLQEFHGVDHSLNYYIIL